MGKGTAYRRDESQALIRSEDQALILVEDDSINQCDLRLNVVLAWGSDASSAPVCAGSHGMMPSVRGMTATLKRGCELQLLVQSGTARTVQTSHRRGLLCLTFKMP
jgi:hypothetical protein